MNNPNPQIDVVLLRQHTSQSVSDTLLALLPSKALLRQINVLVEAGSELTQDELDKLAASGVQHQIRVIDPGSHAEESNALVLNVVQGTHLFCLKAGDRLRSNNGVALQQVLEDLSPDALTYLPVYSSDGQQCIAGDQNPEQHFAAGSCGLACGWSGLIIPKTLFESMGGFNIHYTVVPELEFWMKCYLKSPSSLKHESGLQILAEPHVPDWLFRFGARGVVEKANLYNKLTGSARVNDFLLFAREVTKASLGRPWIQTGAIDRLCVLAYSILYWIPATERHKLLPYLQLTQQVGHLNSDLRSVHTALSKLTGWQSMDSSRAFESNVKFFAIGAYCQAAQVLKDLTLRTRGPLDWVFSSPKAVQHMLSDRFSTFLTAEEILVLTDQEKEDIHANKCDHRFYREQFGVRFMFNHHTPHTSPDREYFRDAAEEFLRTLNDGLPAVCLYVDNQERPSTGCLPIWDALQAYGGQCGLVSVKFRNVAPACLRDEPLGISLDPACLILHLELPVASQTNGLQFKSDVDNRRFRFLVFHALLWMQAVLTNASKA